LPPKGRATLALEQIERWRSEAQKGDGLLRYMHLQHALEIARKHGLSEQAKVILVELQSITPEDLDLKRISAEVNIPREKIDPYIKSFREQRSWQVALERFGAAGPPVQADAHQRFFDDDDGGSLHIVIPQIEAVIRSAAAGLGIVVIKNPQGERPGGVRQLGALLADLGGRVDEPWRRYLVNALNDSLGLN